MYGTILSYNILKIRCFGVNLKTDNYIEYKNAENSNFLHFVFKSIIFNSYF